MSTAVAERTPVDVAVGVLVDPQGRFLLTSRPEGKVYAGYWEIPGGKVEPGETVEEALRRELHEEIGITIGPAEPWHVTLHDYPHALVRLHFCKVRAWEGDFEMRENQRMAWEDLPVQVAPVLPGTIPVLRWFAEERGVRLPAMDWLDAIKWDRDGLVPVIAQERGSGDVLMFAFMNREALAKTVELGEAVYWSRSRNRLWHKGEESGHVQKVRELRLDCDNDVVLLKVEQLGHEPGIACHTGRHSCFYQRLEGDAWQAVEPVLKDPERIYK
jgi:mutator protein MutT